MNYCRKKHTNFFSLKEAEKLGEGFFILCAQQLFSRLATIENMNSLYVLCQMKCYFWYEPKGMIQQFPSQQVVQTYPRVF